MQKVYKIKLKKNDEVIVLSGKDKGKIGKIVATHPNSNKVTVEGINIAKKHVKPNKQNPQGGIIEVTQPIYVSKVAILEPTSKKPSKIGFKLNEDGSKIRIYKKSNKEIK